ncbi:MAG: SlyX family protein [Bdellovibrionota bacterium]|nr:SlyX family protein [Bdellovibrionota bacterium]
MEDLEKRLTDLEMKFSFQDHLIEELNEVIVQQQKEIHRLKNLWLQFEEVKLKGGMDQGIKNLSEEVPPPHY